MCAATGADTVCALQPLGGRTMAIAFRFLALILIVVALMFLGADVLGSLEKGEVIVHSIGQVWALIDGPGLSGFKTWIETTLPAPLPGWIYGLLGMWAFGVTGVLGVILAFLFGRRAAEV